MMKRMGFARAAFVAVGVQVHVTSSTSSHCHAFDTKDQGTAIVTGGSRGIGAAICAGLAQDGYIVVVNYNRSLKEAQKVSFQP